MILSHEDLKRNVKIRYDTDLQQLECSLTIKVSERLHYKDITCQEEEILRDKLLQYLKDKLVEIGTLT